MTVQDKRNNGVWRYVERAEVVSYRVYASEKYVHVGI